VLLRDLPGAASLVGGARAELLALRAEPESDEPYGRRPLYRETAGEVMLAGWRGGAECAPHDHAGGEGVVLVLVGTFTETEWLWHEGGLARGPSRRWQAGDAIPVAVGGIHSMRAHGDRNDDGQAGGTTLHLYRPAIAGMRVFDRARRQTLAVRDDCGAWIPRDEALIVSRVAWRAGR
jgi:cysteine dioxygenase